MPVHVLDCIRRPASGTVAVRIVLEVGLEDRFQHKFGGGLNRTIPDSRNAERALASLADSCTATDGSLFDHFISKDSDGGRYFQAKGLRSLCIDDKPEQCRLLKRQVLRI